MKKEQIRSRVFSPPQSLENTFANRSTKELLSKYDFLLRNLGLGLIGGVFGYATARGLGLTTLPSLLFALFAGVGVYITKSLTLYLLVQVIALSSLSALYFLLFLFNSSLSIPSEFFQTFFATVVVLAPVILIFFQKTGGPNRKFSPPYSLELSSTILFFVLVQFLKTSRPSNSLFALSQMYDAEDNAGVVNVLRQSLELGYSNHVFKFGEFMNAVYLAAAGQITWFGDQEDLGLVSALTHFNLTTLFMAWVPISVMFTIVISGKKLNSLESIVVLGVLSATLILLLWPFVNHGHTSVITASLFAMPLVAIFLNQKFALSFPIFFALTVIVMASIVGSTWFPLAPFATVTVLIAISSLSWTQYKRGKRKTMVGLAISTGLLAITQLPTAIDTVRNDSYYLQLAGGTRSAGELLVLVWLSLAAFSIWLRSRSEKKMAYSGSGDFSLVVLTLISSVLYIFVAGVSANAGTPGYGASKYLITAICISLPVLYISLMDEERRQALIPTISLGVVLILSMIFFQPDTRNVAISFIQPASAAVLETPITGVTPALLQALNEQPDHVLCVSDFGYPAPEEEVRKESYLCTRWAQSLVGGDSDSSGWGFVPLNRQNVSYMLDVVESYKDRRVVLIRFTDSTSPKLLQDVWWSEYVDKSWKIITVR